MKTVLIGILMLGAVMSFSQSNIDLNNEKKKLSKHEVGLEIKPTYQGFLNSKGVRIPKLTYNFYRKENKILHFSGTGAYTRFFKGGGVEIWNENRKYLGLKQKWFLSTGLGLTVGYAEFDYSGLIENEQSHSGFGIGLGYNFGVRYKLTDQFSATMRMTPTITRGFYNGRSELPKWNLSSPIRLGVNFRF